MTNHSGQVSFDSGWRSSLLSRSGRWLSSGDGGGNGAERSRPGLVRRLIRTLQRWWIVGAGLSVCVRVYQHLWALFLRCASCWLPAPPSLLHISQMRANLEHKQEPTLCSCEPNPFIRAPVCDVEAFLCLTFHYPVCQICRPNPHLSISGLDLQRHSAFVLAAEL